MVVGDFHGAAWRRRSDSTVEETFANKNLPIPHGPTALLGPGGVPGEWADVCGFIKPPSSESSSHFSSLSVKILLKKHPVITSQCPGKCTTTAFRNTTMMLFIGVKLSPAQDQGLRFWQTKTSAINVHNLVPANCIYKVIPQNGDRTLFERLSTPRPAPKVSPSPQFQETGCGWD